MRVDFRDVPTVIADESSATGQSLHRILDQLGFRALDHVETMDALRSRITRSEVALLIANAAMAGGDILKLIRAVRRNEMGGQPFVPVITLIGQPDASTTRSIIDSGSDLIFALPISHGRVETGLKTLLAGRKPFVVTSDYVGPDRRSGARGDWQEVPLIEVPNPLRRWATGSIDEPSAKKVLEAINLQRVQRQAVQILYLADLIVAHFSGGESDGKVRSHLKSLQTAATEANGLAVGTKYRNQVVLCELVGTAARDIEIVVEEGGEPKMADLKHLTSQVQVAFDIESPSVSKEPAA